MDTKDLKKLQINLKKYIKNGVFFVLKEFAKIQLKKNSQNIIAITGTAGKTSTKECIASVLERKFMIKKTTGNMNTEFGIALTILNQKNAYSLKDWLFVFLHTALELFKKTANYEILILETGVDKPYDMDNILKIFTPNVSVFLNVKEAHLGEDKFKNRQEIFEEKSKLCLAVPKDGWVILNDDDSFVKQLKDKVSANVITIGTSKNCDLQAKNIKNTDRGLSFDLHYENKFVPVILPFVIGESHVYMALASIAVGFINGMPWRAIELALQDFHLPPGRMNKIDGKNGSIIIDSSYNASPETMESALKVLSGMSGRKICALGTMNELGDLSESAHIKLGSQASKACDILIAVGDKADTIAKGAKESGMKNVHTFINSKEAAEFLNTILQRGDTVLAKGSQNKVRMEHLVKACMKDSSMAGKLLVRQDKYWLINQ